MTFSHYIEDFVQVIEGVGVGILVIGGAWVLARSAVLYVFRGERAGIYNECRQHLGHVILLGLEVLIIADIIRTVIVDQTPSSVAVLATIVIIRILLSFSLDVEIDGEWPWQQAERKSAGKARDS
jgi:uncharacterized membrane protein